MGITFAALFRDIGMVMRWLNRVAVTAVFGLLVFGVLALFAGGADAQYPNPWQLGMQPSASTTKERIGWLHDFLLVIITLITLFVLALLIYVMVRFRASANPKPTRTTHNTTIEIIWTVIPIIILVVIAIPSFKLLYYMDRTNEADLTLKITGNQWFWTYEYPDQGGFKFDSYMIPDADIKPGQKRLLEVDNRVVLPVDSSVRILLAGNDVMHSWLVSSLGVQTYVVPGRVNETWVRIQKPGVYYGQCNQICGINHAYMPIAVEAVSKDQFNRWVEEAKRKFAQVPSDGDLRVAASAAAR
jgi:cytochrome c oxidase subunit 2